MKQNILKVPPNRFNCNTSIQNPNMCYNISSATDEIHSSSVLNITVVYLSLMCFQGTVGNSILITCVIRQRNLRQMTHIFAANSCIIGLLISAVIIPGHIYDIVQRETLNEDGYVCTVFGYLNFALTLMTLCNCNAIALNRYFLIVKPHLKVHMNLQKTIKLCVGLLWLIPITLSVTCVPYLGFHTHMLDCFVVMETNTYWYIIVAMVTPTVATTIIVFILYFLILHKVVNSKRRVAAFQSKWQTQSFKLKTDLEISKDNHIPIIKTQFVDSNNPTNIFTIMDNNFDKRELIFGRNNTDVSPGHSYVSSDLHSSYIDNSYEQVLPESELNTKLDSKKTQNTTEMKEKNSHITEKSSIGVNLSDWNTKNYEIMSSQGQLKIQNGTTIGSPICEVVLKIKNPNPEDENISKSYESTKQFYNSSTNTKIAEQNSSTSVKMTEQNSSTNTNKNTMEQNSSAKTNEHNSCTKAIEQNSSTKTAEQNSSTKTIEQNSSTNMNTETIEQNFSTKTVKQNSSTEQNMLIDKQTILCSNLSNFKNELLTSHKPNNKKNKPKPNLVDHSEKFTDFSMPSTSFLCHSNKSSGQISRTSSEIHCLGAWRKPQKTLTKFNSHVGFKTYDKETETTGICNNCFPIQRPKPQLRRSDSTKSCKDNNLKNSSKGSNTKQNRRTNMFEREIRLSLYLFLAFLCFSCLYLPLTIVHILDARSSPSPDIWLSFYTLELSFSTITWVLYGILNRDFRTHFILIAKCKKFT